MKKALVLLAVAALMVAGSATYAVTTMSDTMQLYGGFNQIAASVVPLNPDFRAEGGCWNTFVFDESHGLLTGDSLQAWDATTQGPVTFPDLWDAFPNILAGDGYIATCTNPQGTVNHAISYDGVNISDTDVWISLPGQTGAQGGWHYVGIPYPVGTQVLVYDVIVTDGVESHTIGEMLENDPGWMDLAFNGWDAPNQGPVVAPGSADFLDGGQMYQVFTKKNNLALILPAPAP